jgi:hypothetical protein
MAEKKIASAPAAYERKKINTEFVDLKELHEQKLKFIGTYLGFRLADGKADPKTGEVKQYRRLFFQRRDPETLGLLDTVAINSDKGLVSQMDNAMVNAGDTVELEWLRKDSFGNEGRSVNIYDVYAISAQNMPVHTARILLQDTVLTDEQQSA